MTDDEARALDRQVALALGFRWMTNRYDKRRFLVGPNEETYIKQSDSVPASLDIPISDHPAPTVPHYSTEIQAAWQVIEFMRERGWEMGLYVNSFVSEPWDCRFFHGEHKRAIAHGGTAPIAICRAAISALEAAQYYDHPE